jgi:hypothetical protein
LQRGFFAELRTWFERAVVAPREVGEFSLSSIAFAIVLEDELWRTPSHQPKTHPKTGIVGAGMTDRRIVSERHRDRAATGLGLEQVRDRDFLDGEMIDRQFVLGVEHDSRVVGIGGALEVYLPVTAHREHRINAEAAEALFRRFGNSCGADQQRS